MKLWVTVPLAPIRDIPLIGKKLCDAPYRALVEWSGDHRRIDDERFIYVQFQANETKAFAGWMYAGYAEEYREEFPAGVVPIATGTPYPHDAAQYVQWMGQVQYNLCGELCVLYCTGWDLEISEFLDKLRELSAQSNKFREFFQRIFPSFKSRGTTPYDLDVMLAAYEGYELPSRSLESVFFDPIAKRVIVSPGRFEEALKTDLLIIGCHIDGQTGKLRGSGILHWVVVEQVVPDEAGRGWALIYNPFNNKMERYSWAEFTASTGKPYGIAVKR